MNAMQIIVDTIEAGGQESGAAQWLEVPDGNIDVTVTIKVREGQVTIRKDKIEKR